MKDSKKERPIIILKRAIAWKKIFVTRDKLKEKNSLDEEKYNLGGVLMNKKEVFKRWSSKKKEIIDKIKKDL